MSASWIERAIEAVACTGKAVRVTVVRADGSTPRETGASMIVTAEDFSGTIGGGALEHGAMAIARELLDAEAEPWRRELRAYPLGPSLGQCCGGAARLLFENLGSAECDYLGGLETDTQCLLLRPLESGVAPLLVSDRKALEEDWPLAVTRAVRDMASGARERRPIFLPGRKGAPGWFIEPLGDRRPPLFLYGAGHVGRAVIRAMQELPFDITWIDVAAERFPPETPTSVRQVVDADPASRGASAPDDALHVVMTFSHALDLAVCHAVLERRDFAYLGVIGSKTKGARFRRRLDELGHSESEIARMHCPIGLEGLGGKEPAVIAASLAADLLLRVSPARTDRTEEQPAQKAGGRD